MIRKPLIVILISLSLVGVLLLAGCGGKRVSRVATDTVTDLSGRWNDTDSQLVAQTIVQEALKQPWLQSFVDAHSGKQPTVIVGRIINKSHEHINVETFIKDIQMALINSQRVEFVSDAGQRAAVRQERDSQQQGYTSQETQAAVGAEVGADFIMMGTVNTILDEEGATRAVWYQVNIELHNLATNKIVWIGQHKIKKIIER
jgi:uncharacterized protein (TIGR02722 family)